MSGLIRAAVRPADLASTAAGKGAALVGFQAAEAGAIARQALAKLRESVTPMDFGAIGDGVTDDTAALVVALNALQDGQTLDLAGRSYKVFTGIAGASSGNAAALNAIPRLSGKANVTIRNGEIFASAPGVSGTKLRYPSTLTVDGCTGVRLLGVTLRSKGESYGDADSSVGLGFEARRAFCAQNGGHALLVSRSSGTVLRDCTVDRAGSVAPCYVMSSSGTRLHGCYSTPRSLGYAAFAFDSWAGPATSSGFSSHDAELYDCRTDSSGDAYGSKGGVFAEDVDVLVCVLGGVYRDAYANGSAHYIGAAFTSVNATVNVVGAQVHNCAAIGLTYHSATGVSKLTAVGVHATGLRTSMHIQGAESFGDSVVRYEGCTAEIVGTALWSELELSVSTVVANRKVASGFAIDIVGCTTRGANTFAVNNRAVYGGYNVVGGEHIVYNRIFDSLGAGGSVAGTLRGFDVSGGARFKVMSPSPAPSLTVPASSALNVIRNQDGAAVLTYQRIDFDASVTIESVAAASLFDIGASGSGLVERVKLLQRCVGCVQAIGPGAPRSGAVRIVSLDGIAGSFYKVTLAYLDGKPGDGMTLVDDAFVTRKQQGVYAGPSVTAGEVRSGVFLSGTTANLTVGATYPASFTG